MLYLNDFLDDLTAQTDAGPAIRAAFVLLCLRIRRTAYSSGWRTPDTTRFRGRKALQFISNNDEGLKRIAFDLSACKISPLKVLTLFLTGFVSPFNSNVAATSRSAIFRSTLPARFTPKVPYGRPETDGSDLEFPTNTDAI